MGSPYASELRTYLLSISNENYNFLLHCLGFFQVQMDSRWKIRRSQLRLTALFQSPLLRASCWWNNFGCPSSFQTCVISPLVLFFAFSDHLFDFGSIFFKGYRRCKTIYCNKMALDCNCAFRYILVISLYYISSFSRYLNFYVFVKSTNFKICDVIISIAT